ncbi:MAG: amino acid permease [Actinobacteria bacterium]|nr:amino acid permease [Actinomycetota bacterium]MCG2820124.1 amino acid permease [Actinomycetes bacterium]MBU4218067.1 amino acid permease [Actinomycetota bacterium]MBU4358354.1 amino acid permease [Actinomycetota bacterium]MBU4391415.1 amino acid permease [Actinomycetota bacterium]
MKDIYLSKHLGAFEVFSISSGTMIGAGIFVLPGLIAAKAGPASILCFLITGLIAGCAALSVSELSTAMPKSGGSYFFVSRSMGAMFGSIVGWGSLLGLTFKGAFAFIGAGDYFEALLPVSPIITALALCALITAINTAGTSVTGRLQNLVVIFMSVIFLLFIVEGLFSIKLGRFEPFFRGSPFSFLEATGMVFITYLGLIKVTAVSEEVKDPGRNLPLGILSSVAFVTVLYTMVMFVTVGVLPLGTLYTSLTPIADAARSFAGPGGFIIMVLCGLMATISTGNAAMLASSRYPFAMARDNLMPVWLSRVDDYLKTPARSILLVGVATFTLVLLVDLESIVKLGSVFNMIVFALVNASVIILRKADSSWYKPAFRSPLYPWVQVLGIAGSLILIPFMGAAAWISALVLVAAGIGWFYLFGRGKAQPEYGLRDAVRTLREKKASQLALASYDSSSHHSWRLLVPLWFSQVPGELLVLAGYLARHFDESVHLAFCNELPEQTPMAVADSGTAESLDLKECLAPLDEDMKPYFHLTNLYAVSREAGFVEMAEDYNTDLALMEWPPDTTHLRWELNRLIREMPCDMAFLLNRAMPGIERVLVASAIPEDRLKLTIAGAIAAETGASVTVMRIYSSQSKEMTSGDMELRILRSGLLYGIPLQAKVVLSDDVPGAIAREASGCDLLIVGAPHENNWLGTPFGPVVEALIEITQCPLLITRPPVTDSHRLPARLLKQIFGPHRAKNAP